MVSEIPEMIMDVVAFVGRGLVRSDALYALQAVLASAAPPGADSADADGGGVTRYHPTTRQSLDSIDDDLIVLSLKES